MKNFNKVAAQGEMLIRRVDGFSASAEEGVERDNTGAYILAHSETGHHHVLDAGCVDTIKRQTENVPEGVGILQLIVKNPGAITHLRGYDTHEPIGLAPGNYEIRLQREHSPEGYRRVAD